MITETSVIHISTTPESYRKYAYILYITITSFPAALMKEDMRIRECKGTVQMNSFRILFFFYHIRCDGTEIFNLLCYSYSALIQFSVA
jgi:hypothetical protein